MRSRCAISLVVALIVSSFATAFVTNLAPAPPAAAQPGSPGVPSDPDVLFTEDFENVRNAPESGVDPAPPENEGTAEMIPREDGSSELAPYIGEQTSYFADPTWSNLAQCNGIVMSPNTAYPPGACPGGPLPDNLVWVFALQPLARALGFFDPLERDPAFNHVLTAWTDFEDVATTPAPVLETTEPIPLPAPGRFVTFSIDVGVQNCNLAADPLLRFFLLDGETAIPITDEPIEPCVNQTAALQLHRLASDSSFLVGAGTSEVGFRLTDDQFEDQGNDFAYDNIRMLDVTPQLDKEFVGDPRFPNAPTVFAGDPATVKFTITNTSELAAKAGWSFTDVLPAGLVVADEPNAAIDCPAGTVTAAPGTSTIAVAGGRLDAGLPGFCEITVDVVSAVPGTFVNLPGDITNLIGLDPPAPATLLVVPPPDLSVVKTANPAGPVNAGDPIGFDITVSNAAGSGTAFGVRLRDVLPTGAGIDWTILSQTGGANCVILDEPEGVVLECGPVDLAGGQPFTVSVQSPTEFASEGDYENSAVAEADNHPPVTGDDTVEVQSPDLTVAKTATAESVNAGEGIGFSIEIANAGLGTATNVTLTDDLNDLNNDGAPDGLVWAVDSADCAITEGVLTCDFGDLGPEETVTVNLTAPTSAAVCGTYDDLAVISADNHPDVDGSDSVTVLCPGLNVVKTANPESPVDAGSPIGFDITVTNNPETGVATGVTLTDTLPAGDGIAWAIVDQTGIDSCAIADGVLTCGPVDLAAGEEFTVSVQSPTVFDSCAEYENTATADATNAPEPVTQIAVTEVQCPALEVEKFANPESPVNAGDPIGFSIVVTNTGPGTATGVTLADTLPPGAGIVWSLTSETGEEANCTLTDGSLSCGPVDLAEGEGFAVQVESPTVFESCGVFENTVALTAGNHPDTGATATTEVQCPSLTVTKTPNAPSVAIGDPIQFTITVTNGGPGDATNVTLTDELPIGPGLEWSITTDPVPADCTITASVLQCTEADLAAGGSLTVTVQSPTVGADCAVVDNNTAMVTADNHPDVSAPASVEVLCPVLEVVKSADPTLVPPGGEVTYTYAVTNTGGAPATNVIVEDSPVCAPIELIGGDDNGNGALDPGETWTFTCTQVITESIDDVVFVTGEAGGRIFEDVDDAAVAVLEAGPGPQPPPPTPQPPPAPPPQPERPGLPFTGADLLRWIPLALALIGLGTAFVRRSRQRRVRV